MNSHLEFGPLDVGFCRARATADDGGYRGVVFALGDPERGLGFAAAEGWEDNRRDFGAVEGVGGHGVVFQPLAFRMLVAKFWTSGILRAVFTCMPSMGCSTTAKYALSLRLNMVPTSTCFASYIAQSFSVIRDVVMAGAFMWIYPVIVFS